MTSVRGELAPSGCCGLHWMLMTGFGLTRAGRWARKGPDTAFGSRPT